jgi:hypothetical protein
MMGTMKAAAKIFVISSLHFTVTMFCLAYWLRSGFDRFGQKPPASVSELLAGYVFMVLAFPGGYIRVSDSFVWLMIIAANSLLWGLAIYGIIGFVAKRLRQPATGFPELDRHVEAQ